MTSKKMILVINGHRIGCSVVEQRKNSTVLLPDGKKNLFKGTAKITIPKNYENNKVR